MNILIEIKAEKGIQKIASFRYEVGKTFIAKDLDTNIEVEGVFEGGSRLEFRQSLANKLIEKLNNLSVSE